MADIELKNDTNLIFSDISSEEFRVYSFPKGEEYRVVAPQWLHVSKSGGHRVLSADGVSHYIPNRWIGLNWKVKPNMPNFVK